MMSWDKPKLVIRSYVTFVRIPNLHGRLMALEAMSKAVIGYRSFMSTRPSLTESEGESKDRRVWWLSFG